jgi:hypothetical protein
VTDPALAQRLETTPAITGLERDAKHFSQLAIEVAQVALRVIEYPDGEVRLAFKAVGQRAQHDALAGAGISLDQGEAAFADMDVLDTPEEVVDLRREVECFAGQLGAEGIPFQAKLGQQDTVHGLGSGVEEASSSSR